MKVKVHEQEKIFYLAAERWVPMVGNEITIGKHSFCATPNGNALSSTIIFSEVTSGARVRAIQLVFFDAIVLDSKEDYLQFLEEQANKLADRLSKRNDLDDEVLKMEHLAISKLGPKPPTEDIDIDEELKRKAAVQ